MDSASRGGWKVVWFWYVLGVLSRTLCGPSSCVSEAGKDKLMGIRCGVDFEMCKLDVRI